METLKGLGAREKHPCYQGELKEKEMIECQEALDQILGFLLPHGTRAEATLVGRVLWDAADKTNLEFEVRESGNGDGYPDVWFSKMGTGRGITIPLYNIQKLREELKEIGVTL